MQLVPLQKERFWQGSPLGRNGCDTLSFFEHLRNAAREVIEKRTHKAAVDADWEKSRQYGVTGVPTYVFGDRGVVGAQPYEALEELVRA